MLSHCQSRTLHQDVPLISTLFTPFELGIGNSLMEISNYELACIISYLAFCLEEFVYLPLLSSPLFSVLIFTEIKNKKRRHQNVKHKGSE